MAAATPSEAPAGWHRVKLAGLTVLFGTLSVTALIFFFMQGYNLATYHTLDARAEGVVYSQVGGKTCDSNVKFRVANQEYFTRHGGCPGVGEPVQVRYKATDPAHATGDGPRRVYGVYPLGMALSLGASTLLAFMALVHAALFLGRDPSRPLALLPWNRG